MRKDNIPGIEILRLVAAFFIMFYHLAFWNVYSRYNSVEILLNSDKPGEYFGGYCYFGWVGVEIFFVISGFVICESAERSDAFSFLRSRLSRLMPSIWICSLISGVATLYTEGYHPIQIVKSVLKSSIVWPLGGWIDDSYWILPIEFGFYALIFLILLMGDKKIIPIFGILLGLISFGIWILYAYYLLVGNVQNQQSIIRFISAPLVLMTVIRYGCLFSLGIAIAEARRGRSKMWYYLCVPLSIACLLDIYATNRARMDATNILMPSYVPMAVWAVCVLALWIAIKYNSEIRGVLELHDRFIRSMGLLTYPLYLLHRPVALAAMKIILQFHLPWYFVWGGGLLSAIVVALLVSEYLEPRLQDITFRFITRQNTRLRRGLEAR